MTTKSIAELILYLRNLEIKLWAEGDNLRVSARKGVLTSALRGELAERKAEILEFLRQTSAPNSLSLPPITPVERSQPLPLSYSQQGLWFLSQLEGPSATYNIAVALRLSGRLNQTALQQSLDEVFRRHEILRATFTTVDGKPAQVIAPSAPAQVQLRDLQDLPRPKQDAALQALLATESRRPFDLEQGPLVRILLARLNTTEHTLLIAMHHIISDGWSVGILFRELSQLYQAFNAGFALPLPPLPIQYADYASWQREYMRGKALEEQLVYWKKQLQGELLVLQLPTDYPRPAAQTFKGALHVFAIPPSLLNALRSIGQQEGATLFMTLLTAFDILLYRYTNQSDILVGAPAANRSQPDIQPLIGYFVNTLVLRADLSGNPSFRELLNRVKNTALEAYAHQDAPFEYVVQSINPERDLSRQPLFQVMFALQSDLATGLDLTGISAHPLPVDTGVSRFDLTLALTETKDDLQGVIEYSADLFESESIARFAGHYLTLLEGIAANPDQTICEAPILTQSEQRQLLVEWNDTDEEPPRAFCVQQLFEEQSAFTPDAVAVEYAKFDINDDSQKLTYAEFNQRANQLTRYLRRRGAKKENVIGLLMERSIEAIIGMMAITKAGVYLPLDSVLPVERLAYMLEDADVQFVVTQAHLKEKLLECARGKLSEQNIVCVDADELFISREEKTNPEIQGDENSPAYIIYTSGSTGQPKGVLVANETIAHHFSVVKKHFQLAPSDRVLQFSAYSFDQSIEQIFSTLISGATLMLRGSELWDPAYFSQVIEENALTVVNIQPAYWRQWLQSAAKMPAPLLNKTLRLVIIGGDAIVPEDIYLWRQTSMRGVKLLNAYGPTETTITASTFEIPREDAPLDFSRVPIGRPLSNRKFYIVDQRNCLVPVGVPGELLIGGAGLAEGYLHHADLTAVKFIPNPFMQAEDSSRVYRSGDLARYLKDGNVEFLGRVDQQVKLRGFRIELGEIESALAQIPGIRESVVVLREDRPNDQRLVAYVVGETSATELSDELRRALPEYMIPSAFVFLDTLPLTPSGKIDRRALPVPSSRQSARLKNYAAPRDADEKKLSALWSKMLGVEQVGIHDSFFELGGHSLLAAQLIFQTRSAFQVDLPLQRFLQTPTIAETAAAIKSLKNNAANPLPVRAKIDFNQEASLPAEFQIGQIANPPEFPPRVVLLSGATGFLGAFLLNEILKQSTAQVYCLARAKDDEEARQRLRDVLSAYLLLDNVDMSRVIPLPGDLTQPRLGLSERRFARLANEVDSIYHCGAEVNFVYPYEKLKAANVFGTQEVLRLAFHRRAIPVHYISTTSVFSSPYYQNKGPIREDESLAHGEGAQGGYAQSKWVAEKIAQEARSRGLPVAIYRPGYISGSSVTGAWNTADFVCRFIKGCILLETALSEKKEWFLTPVDYASQSIIHLSLQKESLGKSFHIVSPRVVYQDQWADWIRSFGYPLRMVDRDQWVDQLKTLEDEPTHPLYPLLDFMLSNMQPATEPSFDCDNAMAGLTGSGITCPPVDERVFRAYLSFFVRNGFLHAPSALQ